MVGKEFLLEILQGLDVRPQLFFKLIIITEFLIRSRCHLTQIQILAGDHVLFGIHLYFPSQF